MQGYLDINVYMQKNKQQFVNLLDVYLSDLHVFGFYDSLYFFSFNFLIHYRHKILKVGVKG